MTHKEPRQSRVGLSTPLQQIDRTYARYRGKRLSYFGGCDYFRLSSDPRVLRAIEEGLSRHGLTVAASRVTTGNHRLYELLEKRLAQFFEASNAVLFSSGYLANLGAAQALAGTFSHALMDERSHASLVDAAQFLDCPVIKFKHRDPDDVRNVLARIGACTQPILLTDGMFSHDGSVAPLKEYLKVLPRDGFILLDDAHGAGVLGRTGKGTWEHERASRDKLIQTIALSKAFGVYGGAVLCGASLREKIVARSRVFSGNTPIPLPLANGALKAVQILSSAKTLKGRLLKKIEHVKSALRKKGYPIPDTPCAIVALVPAQAAEVPGLIRRCVANGVFPSFIRYQNGPAEGYFRFAVSSEHTQEQLESLIRVFP